MVSINKLSKAFVYASGITIAITQCNASSDIIDSPERTMNEIEQESSQTYPQITRYRIDIAQQLQTTQTLCSSITVKRLNTDMVKISAPLPKKVNPYAYEALPRGGWKDIWGRIYPAGSWMGIGTDKFHYIVYPNGDIRRMDCTFSPSNLTWEDNSELYHCSQIIYSMDSGILGRVIKENKYGKYFEDGAFLEKHTGRRIYPDGSARGNNGLWILGPNPKETIPEITIHPDGSWTTPDGITHHIGGKD